MWHQQKWKKNKIRRVYIVNTLNFYHLDVSLFKKNSKKKNSKKKNQKKKNSRLK